MADRPCVDCGAALQRKTPTARWPKRCAGCADKHRAEYLSQYEQKPERQRAKAANASRWRRENPERHTTYQRDWRRRRSNKS